MFDDFPKMMKGLCMVEIVNSLLANLDNGRNLDVEAPMFSIY